MMTLMMIKVMLIFYQHSFHLRIPSTCMWVYGIIAAGTRGTGSRVNAWWAGYYSTNMFSRPFYYDSNAAIPHPLPRHPLAGDAMMVTPYPVVETNKYIHVRITRLIYINVVHHVLHGAAAVVAVGQVPGSAEHAMKAQQMRRGDKWMAR